MFSVTLEETEDIKLLSYLGHGQDKYIGYLKPAREDLTTVVLVAAELTNQLKLVGWDFQESSFEYETTRLISYDITANWVLLDLWVKR